MSAEQESPCLSADFHNTEYRTSFILCHKPRGHDGDHGNEFYSWPKYVASPVPTLERQEENDA